MRSRTRDLAQRRPTLVKLLIAIYSLTAVFVVAAPVLLVLGDPHDRLLDIAVVGRELTTVVFIAVILAAYMSMRRAR